MVTDKRAEPAWFCTLLIWTLVNWTLLKFICLSWDFVKLDFVKLDFVKLYFAKLDVGWSAWGKRRGVMCGVCGVWVVFVYTNMNI